MTWCSLCSRVVYKYITTMFLNPNASEIVIIIICNDDDSIIIIFLACLKFYLSIGAIYYIATDLGSSYARLRHRVEDETDAFFNLTCSIVYAVCSQECNHLQTGQRKKNNRNIKKRKKTLRKCLDI